MYGFLYLDVLHVHICMFIHMFGFLYLDVQSIVRRIARITNICMASFIWMYCMFIQQL